MINPPQAKVLPLDPLGLGILVNDLNEPESDLERGRGVPLRRHPWGSHSPIVKLTECLSRDLS